MTAMLIGAAAIAAGPGGYPNKPVKVVVPFAPAGPTDVMARLIAQKLSEVPGQQFYVENHAGAGGNIGMGMVAKSPADGYTILVASSSYVVNPSLYAKNPYDPYKDFAPVTLAAASPNIVVVHPDVPVKTMKELVDYIKANPGKSSYRQSRRRHHAAARGRTVQAAAQARRDQRAVRRRGSGDPVGRRPAIRRSPSPRCRRPRRRCRAASCAALAVTSAKRSAAFPDVPTLEEAGVKGQESETMQGVFLPGGAPKELVQFLNAEIAKVMAMPDVKAKCAQLGFDVVANYAGASSPRTSRPRSRSGASVIREAKIEQIK